MTGLLITGTPETVTTGINFSNGLVHEHRYDNTARHCIGQQCADATDNMPIGRVAEHPAGHG